MATTPVLDRIQRMSVGQDADNLPFRRLGEVRARHGTRRRRSVVVATTLITVLAAAGVLGLTARRGAMDEERSRARLTTAIAAPTPAPVMTHGEAASADRGRPSLDLPAEHLASPDRPAGDVPVGPRVERPERVRSVARAHQRRRPDLPPRPERARPAPAAPAGAESQDSDATAVIDWLLQKHASGGW